MANLLPSLPDPLCLMSPEGEQTISILVSKYAEPPCRAAPDRSELSSALKEVACKQLRAAGASASS